MRNLVKISGNREDIIYNTDDFPYSKISNTKTYRGSKGIDYLDTFMTFDIESTSTIYNNEHIGFMYVWQATIGDSKNKWKLSCHGRTWFDFLIFMNEIHKQLNLKENERMVIYVHNLSFEYQFLRNIIDFKTTFATDKRKVLKCSTEWQEFRCSYKLSNMSLDKFCKYTNAPHKKATEYFDYSKTRTCETYLTDLEMYYILCDVLALHEAICKLLEEDTLATIPLTSTGFVRRDCRNAMKKNPKNFTWFKKCALSKEVYELIEEAKRGGDTHANRHYAGQILYDVESYDFSSSYPFCMCCKYYPVTRFNKINRIGEGELQTYLDKKCCIFRVYFKNLNIKGNVTNPYISFSKCRDYKTKGTTCFNGRVLHADVISMTVTELDFDIIQREYAWESIAVSDFYIADRGMLPVEIREEIIKFYEHKTLLKYIDPYLYAKDKNKLNAIFGMAFTNPVHLEVYFDKEENAWKTEAPDLKKVLEEYSKNRNNFLPYAVGLYTTAHARHNLRDIICIAGSGNVYNDTDSSKIWGVDVSKEIEEYNKGVIELAEKYGAYADDSNGVRHYMGVAEKEKGYEQFRTWGAKKYCVVQDGKLELTLAGVDKKKGATQLESLSDFKIGKVFLPDCGRRTVRYNDWKDARYIEIEGVRFLTGSGIHMENGTYELGVTDEFTENLDLDIDELNRL